MMRLWDARRKGVISLRYASLVFILLLTLAGCDQSQNSGTQKSDSAKGSGAANSSATGGEGSASDNVVREPATVEQAAKVLDLRTFPLLPGVDEPPAPVMASSFYIAKGNVKSAYEFIRKELLKRKFKELSQDYPTVTEQSASGQFTRGGFHVSLSVSAGSDVGTVTVSLRNHSNVNLAKLPAPAGAKLQYAFPGIASFVTDAPVEETAGKVRELLMADAWDPYGAAGDSMYFKKNAVQLNARVLAPPAQPGKTVIDYSASQLSAELPAPADAELVQYADQIKRLNADAPDKPENVIAYYRKTLGTAGWQATTENTIKDRDQQMLIFRNAAKDMLTLIAREVDGKTRLSLQHQSRQEVEELDRQIDEQIAERKKKLEEDRNRPKPKAVVRIPASAQGVDASEDRIEFKVASGSAKAAVAAIEKALQADGWKAESHGGDAMAGELTLEKDKKRISVLYVDPGLIPGEITISGTGVTLVQSLPEQSRDDT